jgi:hypothetical protein
MCGESGKAVGILTKKENIMFNKVNMESYNDLFPILRKVKLIGLSLKETEYRKAELEDLGGMLIDTAENGLNALDQVIRESEE